MSNIPIYNTPTDKSYYKPIIDKKGRLVRFLGLKVNYKNRGTIDDYINDEWIRIATREGRLITLVEILENKVFVGMNYSELEIVKHRVESILAFENSLWIDKNELTVFKVDITDLTGELDDVSFKSVLRLFDSKHRWSPLLNEKVYKKASVVECGDNGNVGMHVYFVMDCSSYSSGNDRNKDYIKNRNYIVQILIECIKQHVEIRHIDINVSEMLQDKLIVIKKNDIEGRNSLINWLLYICKINSMTRGWLMSGKKKLFSVGQIRSL